MDDHVNWKIYKLSGKAQYDEEYAGDSPLFPRVTKAFRMCIITVKMKMDTGIPGREPVPPGHAGRWCSVGSDVFSGSRRRRPVSVRNQVDERFASGALGRPPQADCGVVDPDSGAGRAHRGGGDDAHAEQQRHDGHDRELRSRGAHDAERGGGRHHGGEYRNDAHGADHRLQDQGSRASCGRHRHASRTFREDEAPALYRERACRVRPDLHGNADNGEIHELPE